MKTLSSNAQRRQIRLSYLLPAISGALMLVLFAVPCMFFLYNGEAYQTWSLFGLLGNTWKVCGELSEASANAVWFSFTMRFFVIASYLALIGYALVAVPSAICSCKAFSVPYTHPDANHAKRWLRFFCPNRVTYALVHLLPLLPALFPHILLANYRSQLGYFMELWYTPQWLPLWSVVALLIVVDLVGAFALLGAQAREQMDMFCLYKKK